jgi:lysophospholipase L1-like esterase
MSLHEQMPPLADVVSPGKLGTKVIQDEFRDRFDKDNALIKTFGGKLDAVYIGDSLTAGWCVPDLLRDLFPHAINRGVGGDSAHWLKDRIEADVIQLAPRWCVLMIGTNDIAHRFGYDDDDTIVADYAGNLRACCEPVASTGIGLLLGTVPPVYNEGTRGVMQIMYDRKVKIIPRMNEQVETIAAELGGHVVDYYTHFFDDSGGVRDELFRDQCHFNARGQALMTVVLRAKVREVLGAS